MFKDMNFGQGTSTLNTSMQQLQIDQTKKYKDQHFIPSVEINNQTADIRVQGAQLRMPNIFPKRQSSISQSMPRIPLQSQSNALMTHFKKILVQDKSKSLNPNILLETERQGLVLNPILTMPDKSNKMKSRTVSRMINRN